MKRKKYKLFLISIVALNFLGIFIFFMCQIWINLINVGSANAEIQQKMSSEKNDVNSYGFRQLSPSIDMSNRSAKKMLKIFGSEAPSLSVTNFKKTKGYIDAFFSHIDDQPYIKSYKSFKGSQQQFNEIIKILSANPPTITRETDSFEVVSKNVFYFYRIFGKERILLLKDMLSNELEIIEPIMNIFYQWLTHSTAYSNQNNIRLSIKQLCGYAGFFLETFGGRSYLFRRSTKVRTLISYYCILIINKANEEGYNPYGLDIRPHIELAFENIVQQTGFDYKDHYLNELAELRKKYHIYSSK